jgi:uncharacterized protein (DUF427 family)
MRFTAGGVVDVRSIAWAYECPLPSIQRLRARVAVHQKRNVIIGQFVRWPR